MLLTTCLESDPTGFFLPSGNLLVGVLLIHTNKSCWRLYQFTNWDAHPSRINLLKRPATQLLENPLRFRPEEPAQRVANQIDVENDDGGGGDNVVGDDDVKNHANTES